MVSAINVQTLGLQLLVADLSLAMLFVAQPHGNVVDLSMHHSASATPCT